MPLRREQGFRWRRADLEAAIGPRTRAVLFNSPHNPTGVVHTEEDLAVLADTARDHDLLVITDEVYERVTWGLRRHTSLASRPEVRDRTVTIVCLTKTFSMGGWRIGFAFAPAAIARAMITLQQHLLTCASSIAQAGAAAAFGEPPRTEVLSLWRDWERRCEFVTSELDASPGVRCAMPEAGF